MKRIVFVALLAIVVFGSAAGSALAANSIKAGSLGMNVDVNDNFVITGKYFVAKEVAVLAGFGIGVDGGDASGTNVGFLVGARKYLKADDFAPFVGGTFFYSSSPKGVQKNMNLMGEVGAEYFLGKQFSVEGKVGFGYMTQETDNGNTTTRNNTVGTDRAGISFNYYFF